MKLSEQLDLALREGDDSERDQPSDEKRDPPPNKKTPEEKRARLANIQTAAKNARDGVADIISDSIRSLGADVDPTEIINGATRIAQYASKTLSQGLPNSAAGIKSAIKDAFATAAGQVFGGKAQLGASKQFDAAIDAAVSHAGDPKLYATNLTKRLSDVNGPGAFASAIIVAANDAAFALSQAQAAQAAQVQTKGKGNRVPKGEEEESS